MSDSLLAVAYRLRFVPGRSRSFRSKKNSDRLIAEWLGRDRQPEPQPEERITITALSARYLAFAKGHYQ